MEELLIDDKKYISLKQAAQKTGYAKDYIGQLCREGRVQARLIGRSWYVLETALQDHRFGPKPASAPKEKEKADHTMTGTWDSPRYEAASAEVLPQTKPEEKEMIVPGELNDPQSSWNEWFERFDTVAKSVMGTSESAVGPQEERVSEEETAKEDERPEVEHTAVDVPIRAMHEPVSAALPPRIDRPVSITEEEEEYAPHMEREYRGSRSLVRTVQVVMAVLMLASVASAVAGSGYVDRYIISHRQVSQLAGVIYFNK